MGRIVQFLEIMEPRNKVMPWFLKVIATCLLGIGVFFVVCACIPFGSRKNFAGEPVGFFLWWLHGVGPLIFTAGLVFLALCYGLTFATQWSRLAILGGLVLGRCIAIAQTEGLTAASVLGSIAVVGFLTWYFYRRHTVVAYFARAERAAKTP